MSMGAVSTTAAIAFLEGMKRALDILADPYWTADLTAPRQQIKEDMMRQKAHFEHSIGVPLGMPKGWI